MAERDTYYTKETDKRFTLRMDKKLFEKIEVSAKRNRRSVAKEIETAVAMYLAYSENQHNDGTHF